MRNMLVMLRQKKLKSDPPMGAVTARPPWSLLLALLLVGAATVLFPLLSRADTLPPIIIGPASATTVEGSTLDVSFTVTNPSGNTSPDALTITAFLPTFLIGDQTDIVTSVTNINQDACGGLLAVGSSCTVTVSYATASDIGELVGDSGTSIGKVTVSDQFGNGPSFVNVAIRVQDAPEPSSVLLTATGLGLLGAGLVRRRFPALTFPRA
jgi:hypothetical protein